MKTRRILFAMLKADLLERTRRSSFLVTLCLTFYLGYAVNAGTILVKLDGYRGVYNSAWVGSLMALVITFFLGIAGFFLVKNTIDRDERTGVGQIIATTPLTRPQYVLGKWLSNFTLLTALVAILALAAVCMQLFQREDPRLHLWALIAPFLFIALPMMALVAACAVLFETIRWLKGGFGNLVYFVLFLALFVAGIFLADAPWLDVTGVSLIGASMKAAARATYPGYSGSFVLAMISDRALQTFIWPGLSWTAGLIFQRLLWLIIAIAMVLVSALLFNRFDSSQRARPRSARQAPAAEGSPVRDEPDARSEAGPPAHLTPLSLDGRFHRNTLRLAWLEGLLLVKGLRWYWLAGMVGLWLGSVTAPAAIRPFWFMLIGLWPVLIWSNMGEREAHYATEQLVFQAASPVLRLMLAAWLAGVALTALAASGVLVGRLLASDPLQLLPWTLTVLFIPSLALALGTWSRTSMVFQVVYPILWYLGPFNRDSGLAVLDFLGIHAEAAVNTAPLLVGGVVVALLLLALGGRARQARL